MARDLKLDLKLEVELESDILETIEVNGETYYKLNEPLDVDKDIIEAIKRCVFERLQWEDRYNNLDIKSYVKQFCDEHKEEIIERAATKIKDSIIHTKQMQELKKEVL